MAVPRAVAGCAALSPAKSAASHERLCRIFAGYADFGWKIQRLHRVRRANRLCGSTGGRRVPAARLARRDAADGRIGTYHPFADWETAEPGDIIGGFTTFYGNQQGRGKAAAREHNISEGVKRIDGVAVEREETFSFNALCAPYRHSNGYELAPNVSTDGFGYGGGVCQVTTTLYNAALTLPLQIEEWALHSKQGAVYVPQFFDAAVGNYSDFTFVNLLPYGVQIHASAQNGVLTVLFCRAEEDSQ